MTYTVLDAKWWTPPIPPMLILGSLCIGAVAIESGPNDEWKVYIGYGLGKDEERDRQLVAIHGMPIGSKEAACGLFPQLDPEKFLY